MMPTIKNPLIPTMVTHICKLVVICNQDRYQRCGFKTTPKTSTKTKLQVLSGIYSINLINLVISHQSQVTSYTQGQRNPKSRLSVFVAAWHGIFQDLQEIVLKKICYNIFCCYIVMYSPGYQSLFTLILPTGYVYSYPTYHLGINIS